MATAYLTPDSAAYYARVAAAQGYPALAAALTAALRGRGTPAAVVAVPLTPAAYEALNRLRRRGYAPPPPPATDAPATAGLEGTVAVAAGRRLTGRSAVLAYRPQRPRRRVPAAALYLAIALAAAAALAAIIAAAA